MTPEAQRSGAGLAAKLALPLTTNELMLGALLLANVIAVLLIWRRRGVLARRTA